MTKVRPKKYLGQHFLKDLQVAEKIVDALTFTPPYQDVLEVGPGMGVLTDFLLQKSDINLYVIDIDKESIDYLQQRYPQLRRQIIEGDILKWDPAATFENKFGLIGNFPYNISSQIFFRVLELKDKIPEVVCMVQREVANRIVSPPGNKAYGILSVLLQAFYHVEYLFTVEPHVFRPPPKVQSAVMRFQRNEVAKLSCDEALFKRVVKEGFQNRRKTLRNALKRINLPEKIRHLSMLDLRAEQLSVDEFVALTKKIEES
ncbi:16S rRNA (adenine(1518)-N(6)/adenine(1519)-N(6))-dimethyltransferase RsmA [Fulvivirgaceae bacterium BMA12]|uniref:Ribosomal RNA small subunit methyltransferase A n=1 Tax=Agaribacillus aureus TaxID=3051825 RepID=A0ABT8LCH1_9BACT|nr:16S rRNA (adenine(1518)-N(6)/adenine(1519)-N(6))-dimethyltransferase RsmA [Fulvivirgaceae bacterium BMA12]